MKKTKRQILTLFLAFVMCITAVDVRAYADTTQNVVGGSGWDGVTNMSVYEGENFRVTFSLMSYWQGGFNANVRIDNTGTEIIENWSLGLDYPGTLSHVWNAEIVAGENGHYVMKNASWNQDIPVGGSVEFGIGEQEDFCGFPTNYELIGELSDVSVDDYAAAYTLVSDWGSGFSATISISNRTEQAIEDWVLEFDFDREITDLWNGVIESHTGNHYVIRNAGYNSMIAAGAEIVVGFNGTGGRAEDEPQAYTVHQYSNGTTGDNTEVDSDGDGLSDYIEDCLWTDKNQKDTDGDGLPDNLEVETFGTDPLNPDTDVDGLPDGYEVLILGTDPLKIDSDDNGIFDSDEDFDEDGLCNFDEYLNDTNPWNCDSDEDGLTDGEEVNVYGTSPINSDTDDDELTDGMELKYDMNPTNPDTLNDGILDGNRIFSIASEDISDNGDVKMFISVDLQGKNINSFTSERVSEEDYFLNPEIPGYLGNAFDFNMNGTFSKATLTYELNEKLFDSSDFVPAIYYWDEKEQFLFEVPNQTIVGNTVSVELEHFSKYIVIAKNKYEEKLFEFEILSPTNEEYKNRKFDVIFVLDESGSISYGNFYTMKNMCKNLVSTFDNNDRVSVYTFDDVIRRRSGFTDKKSAALTLSSLDQHKGWTAIYNAIYSATDEFISYSDSDATKIMIVLTDGIDCDSTYTPSEVTQRALDHNIIIYTIGIGSVNEYVLNGIASSTGGAYYSGANFSQLEGIFNKFISDFDLYKDSDRDNISDYHEKKISAGELKGGTGAPVKNFTSLDYLNSDSDGDGLIDGNELEIKYQTVKGRSVYYCYLYSNPCMMDSDNDGLLDGKAQKDDKGNIIAPKDPNPLTADGPIGVWQKHISSTIKGMPYKYAEGFDAYRTKVSIPKRYPFQLKYTLRAIGALAADAGGIVLDFKLDNERQAYHSNIRNWQKIGGYNDLYDEIFRIGTYDVINRTKTISKEKFVFDVGNKKYVLWVWRGNYLNLGAGAEIGIYTNPQDIYTPDILGHKLLWTQWDVPGIRSFNPNDINKTPNLLLKMTLSLYQDNHDQSYEKIFNWAPADGQWWITGFNNNYMFPNSKDLVTIGSINFEGHEDMYNGLKDAMTQSPNLRNYMIFDDTNKTAWLIWDGI